MWGGGWQLLGVIPPPPPKALSPCLRPRPLRQPRTTPAPGLSLPLCGAAAPRLMTLGAAALRMLATPSPGPPPAPLSATPSKGSAARPETFGLGMWGGSPGP